MCQNERCSYAANEEKAVFVKPEQSIEGHQPLEDVHTPGIKTIEELAQTPGHIGEQDAEGSVFTGRTVRSCSSLFAATSM